jgi:hypothetical protein
MKAPSDNHSRGRTCQEKSQSSTFNWSNEIEKTTVWRIWDADRIHSQHRGTWLFRHWQYKFGPICPSRLALHRRSPERITSRRPPCEKTASCTLMPRCRDAVMPWYSAVSRSTLRLFAISAPTRVAPRSSWRRQCMFQPEWGARVIHVKGVLRFTFSSWVTARGTVLVGGITLSSRAGAGVPLNWLPKGVVFETNSEAAVRDTTLSLPGRLMRHYPNAKWVGTCASRRFVPIENYLSNIIRNTWSPICRSHVTTQTAQTVAVSEITSLLSKTWHDSRFGPWPMWSMSSTSMVHCIALQ